MQAFKRALEHYEPFRLQQEYQVLYNHEGVLLSQKDLEELFANRADTIHLRLEDIRKLKPPGAAPTAKEIREATDQFKKVVDDQTGRLEREAGEQVQVIERLQNLLRRAPPEPDVPLRDRRLVIDYNGELHNWFKPDSIQFQDDPDIDWKISRAIEEHFKVQIPNQILVQDQDSNEVSTPDQFRRVLSSHDPYLKLVDRHSVPVRGDSQAVLWNKPVPESPGQQSTVPGTCVDQGFEDPHDVNLSLEWDNPTPGGEPTSPAGGLPSPVLTPHSSFSYAPPPLPHRPTSRSRMTTGVSQSSLSVPAQSPPRHRNSAGEGPCVNDPQHWTLSRSAASPSCFPSSRLPGQVNCMLVKDAFNPRFGFVVNEVANGDECLCISSVHYTGCLAKWNSEHRDTPVSRGDLIWAVNGITKDARRMMQALSSTSSVCLHISQEVRQHHC